MSTHKILDKQCSCLRTVVVSSLTMNNATVDDEGGRSIDGWVSSMIHCLKGRSRKRGQPQNVEEITL